MGRITSGGLTAWLATLFLWIPSVIAVFLYFGWTGETFPSYNERVYRSRLDPLYLKKLWNYRSSTFSYLLAIDFFVCVGLLFALHSILCLKKIFRNSPGLSKNLMVYSFVTATILPIIEFLRNLGAYEEAYNLYQDLRAFTSDTPNDSYIALEISFRMTQAQSIWIFSSIYLAVGMSLVCASYLFWGKPDFPSKRHAYLGIGIAGLGFLSFSFEVTSFFDADLMTAFGVATLFWGVVAFPVWLVWLGVRLHRHAAMTTVVTETTRSGHHEVDMMGEDVEEMDANMSL